MRMCTDERAASTSAKIRGKKVLPLDPRLDRRRGRPGEVERRVAGPRSGARRERLGRGLRARGRHRSRRRRPARMLRDPEHLLVDEDEDAGHHQPEDREREPQPSVPYTRASVAAHCPRTSYAALPGAPGCRSSRRSRSRSRSWACSDVDEERAGNPQWNTRPARRLARGDRRGARAPLDPLAGQRNVGRGHRRPRQRRS